MNNKRRAPARAAWRTSTYSTGGQNCVEVGPSPSTIGVRDTKNRDAGSLAVPRAAWAAFIASIAAR